MYFPPRIVSKKISSIWIGILWDEVGLILLVLGGPLRSDAGSQRGLEESHKVTRPAQGNRLY